MHNFTQSGWLILFNRTTFLGSSNWGKPSNTPFSQNNFVLYRRLLSNSSSSSMAPWRKPSKSWTPWLFFLDQEFPVEYGLDTFKTPHTGITLRHPKSPSDTERLHLSATLFWRHARFSLKQPELQNHGDFNVYFIKQQTWLLRTYLPRTSNNALK